MDLLTWLCIVSITITGLTSGAGVLPAGPLNAAVGDGVVFTTTLTAPENPFISIACFFGNKNIITSTSSKNITTPKYKDRVTLFPSTGSLELRNVTLNDTGKYRISILRDGGQLHEGSTILQVHGLTSGAGLLPDGPLNAAVGDGVVFTTTLTAHENPFIFIAWYFGNKNIITSTSSTNETTPEYKDRVALFPSTGSLELRDVTLNDSGKYRISIVQNGGQLQEGSTKLQVHERVANVVVTANTTDVVEFSRSVCLSCSTSGTSPSFLWLNSSFVVTPSDRVQLTNGRSALTIVNVTRYDQGPFRCHAFNPISNGTSKPVTLSISYGPENVSLTIFPLQEYYVEGSNIHLLCSAVSNPAALFEWLLNRDKLLDTGPELSLSNIQMSQSGNYSCQALNSKTLSRQTSQPSVVSVLEKISGVSVTPSTNLLVEGNSVNLTCEAAGSVFTRKWMKDGSDLPTTGDMTLYNNSRVLSFQAVKRTDNGTYSCNVSNPVSSGAAEYTMVVNYGPDNVHIIGPNTIDLTQTLTLTCSAESTPSATYTWKLNGTEILNNSPKFTKNSAELSDSGDYICQAGNNITGKTSSVVHQLTVTALPENTSSCSAGCVAGIVIACFAVLGAGAGGGYYIYNKNRKQSCNRDATSRTGNEDQDNAAQSGSQELSYADVSHFVNKAGGRVQLRLDNNSTEYAQVITNNSAPAASSPPTYDAHMQQKKRPAPQPRATGL